MGTDVLTNGWAGDTQGSTDNLNKATTIVKTSLPSTDFGVGAKIILTTDGITYENTGSYATPVWTGRTGSAGQAYDIAINLSTTIADYTAPASKTGSSDSGIAPTTDFSDDWASYADQAAADAVWATNNTNFKSDVTNDELDFNQTGGQVAAKGCSKDFGAGAVSDSYWEIRFKLRVDSFTGYSSGGAAHSCHFIISSVNHTNNLSTAQDSISFGYRTNPTKWGFGFSDGAGVGSGDATFTRAVAVETLYVKIRRVSPTTAKCGLYSDSAYTTLLEEQTITVPNTVVGLRYFVVQGTSLNGYVSGSGDIAGAIDDFKFYNAIGDISLYHRTNSEANPNIYYDFTSARDHVGLCLTVDTVNTTETQFKIRISTDTTFTDGETVRTINKSDFTNKIPRFILINRLAADARYIQVYAVTGTAVVIALWFLYARYGITDAITLRQHFHRKLKTLSTESGVDSN